MIKYAIVPDGLSAFGVEITGPGRFQSVRGFASFAEARAWIIEQDKAEARRLTSMRTVRLAADLILRNRELLGQAERARHRAILLCSPSLLCRVLPDMDEMELIRRNRALVMQAADLRTRTQEILVTTEMAIQGAQRALIAGELRRMNKKSSGALGKAEKVGTAPRKVRATA